MTIDVSSVLPLPIACERFGIEYTSLRELVNAGVFTKHVFDPENKRPPIFVLVDELKVWKDAKDAGRNAAEAVVTHRLNLTRPHDLGEAGA
jgi:hypothetical protein